MYASSAVRASTRSSALSSSSLNSSDSRTIRSTCSSERRSLLVIRICAFLPEVVSFADTARMPFASRSKVTSICATPRGSGGKPLSSKEPSMRLSSVILRSPSNTLLLTATWLSSDVVYTFIFCAGMTVLRGMIAAITPPVVSIPSVSGDTSSSSSSSIFLSRSPERTPACTAAPYATASSGLIVEQSSLPSKNSESNARILGTRVEPPTSTTSSIAFLARFESLSTALTAASVCSKRTWLSCSNLARESWILRSSPS
mmetsp:Transcript_9083/g.24163  ORF Transcript_9083/g.24163 Transcript_9083/m.24163 type:complete len:258 (-) Transcript_9083:584-1357(-)